MAAGERSPGEATLHYRQNQPQTRLLVMPFVILAGAGAAVLLGLPSRTDEFFAWALTPPISAQFMGAGYAAGVVLTILSYRRQPWAITRPATLTIFVFVLVMTVTTFLHLEPMHLDADVATARFAGWAWVVVYVVVTPALFVVIGRQSVQPGEDPPRTAPLPVALRVALGIQGAVLASLGTALFFAPEAMDAVWPWAITALSGRALAAWILAIAFASLWVVGENDLDRARPAAITFAVLGALWLSGAARSAEDVRWERPSAWLYLAVAVFAVSAGIWGWRAASAVGGDPSGPARSGSVSAPAPAERPTRK